MYRNLIQKRIRYVQKWHVAWMISLSEPLSDGVRSVTSHLFNVLNWQTDEQTWLLRLNLQTKWVDLTVAPITMCAFTMCVRVHHGVLLISGALCILLPFHVSFRVPAFQLSQLPTQDCAKGWLYPSDVRAGSWALGLQQVSLSWSMWLAVSMARPSLVPRLLPMQKSRKSRRPDHIPHDILCVVLIIEILPTQSAHNFVTAWAIVECSGSMLLMFLWHVQTIWANWRCTV